MLRLLLPVFYSVLRAMLESAECRAWLSAVDGPGAVTSLERIMAHADVKCIQGGWRGMV